MIQIKTDGKALDIPNGFTIAIEDTNPLFNERGSQSIPATVPATRRNIAILNAPHRMDAGTDPNNPERVAEIIAGAYVRSGTMNITEAGKTDGITFNIGFDNSTAYAKWSQKKLSDLSGLPVFSPQPQDGGYRIEWLLEDLYRLYIGADPQKDDFAIFPLAISKEDNGSGTEAQTYWEILNLTSDHSFIQPGTVKRIVNGEVTDVSIPEGYCVSPFLRVWRVLELVFADLGVEIESNPFKSNLELSRLVVLNNAADSCCLADISYAHLLPDCTVGEFMNALWVRFGLVYNINNDTARVSLRFIKDMIARPADIALDAFASGYEKICYETPQYVKLSAKTSIEGAAPGQERFEDFTKGLDTSRIRQGPNVNKWRMTGTPDRPEWDGEVRDDWYDRDPDNPDPEPPDPDFPEPDPDDGRDDYDDYDDYGRRGTPSRQRAKSAANTSFIAREFVSGQWYRLDATNGKVKAVSSSFFNWDPQPDGLTPLELSSDDECIPVNRVSNLTTGTGHRFSDYCPMYLFGARHYHSYIKGSDDNNDSGDRTPLAFLFAYTRHGHTVGRVTAETADGSPIILDDGTKPSISLLFQFNDGLFARFWAGYDEILRHGNRAVEIKTRIDKIKLHKLDILNIHTFKGIRCFVDSMSYSLPSGREIAVDMKLRTMQTQGSYDIRKEQNIPDFSVAARHLEWRLYKENYGVNLNTTDIRRRAIKEFISSTDYEPHGPEGDYWYVSGPESAVFKRISRLRPTWQEDADIPAPQVSGQRIVYSKYNARLVYDIYEMHDTSTPNTPGIVEPAEAPVAEVAVDVQYMVELEAVWVSDRPLS